MIDTTKESGKHFPRWYKFHCRPVEPDPKYANTEEWVNPFTFDRDISHHLLIRDIYSNVRNTINLKEIKQNIDSWYEINKRYHLWDQKGKNELLKNSEKFHNLTTVKIEEKLANYQKIIFEISRKDPEKDVGFIKIENNACIAEFKTKAKDWLNGWANVLIEITEKELKIIKEQVEDYKKRLVELPGNSLDKLKDILGTCANVKDISMNMELYINDVQEKYRTLLMYGFDLHHKDNRELAQNLHELWKKLEQQSSDKQEDMIPYREKQSKLTLDNVDKFKKEIEAH
jgi:hypothetical protein